MARTFRGIPENRNFLYPTGFHLSIMRAPTVGYYGQQVNIPDLNLGIVEQPSYTKSIPIPGEIIDFGDLTLNFMVDEDLGNYMEIQNWIRGIGFPNDLSQIYDWQNKGPYKNTYPQGMMNLYSNGVLSVFDSQNQVKIKVVFEDMFPYQLSTLDFDSTVTDMQPLTAQVSFKYTIYNFKKTDANC